MKLKLLYLLLFWWMAAANPSFGQVNFGGLMDFELRKGAADSDPTVNQTPDDEWLVYVPTARIFFNAPVSEDWKVSGGLQSDYYNGHFSDIFFSSLNISWMPSNLIKLTAGRFATPFGRYEELLLSSKTPFVHKPLTHVWNLPVDRKRGYVFAKTSYGSVPGMSMVYRRQYSQGLMLGGVTENETLQYQLAATLTSVSSWTDIGQQDNPALVGRIVFKPVIWNKIGLSLSRGPYLIDDKINYVLADEQRESYLQTIATAYTEFSYHYYQLLLQYTFNRWDSPWINSNGGLVEEHLETDVAHFMTQFKVRFPFWVGGFGAIRYEQYRPEEITSQVHQKSWQPTPDKDRWEMVIGYKINRNITLKTSYLLSRNDGRELRDDVFSIQLNAAF